MSARPRLARAIALGLFGAKTSFRTPSQRDRDAAQQDEGVVDMGLGFVPDFVPFITEGQFDRLAPSSPFQERHLSVSQLQSSRLCSSRGLQF